MTRTWTRWLPAAAVPVVVAASVTLAGSSAGADELPDRTPEQVLTLLASHDHQPLSGEFTQTSDLGLPSLPGDLPGTDDATTGVLTALDLIDSDHTGRVFVGEQDQARVQVFDTFGERDVIVDGDQAWFYDSGDDTATHLTAPENAEDAEHTQQTPTLTPEQLAQHVIEAADPSTALTIGENVQVAGRTAYDLVLTPRSTDTLVGQVSIAVDGETGLPLQVTITARGQSDPALQVGYTSLDLTAPDAGLFDFTPPSGTTVEEVTPGQHDGQGIAPGEQSPVEHVGTGWDSVLLAPAGTLDLSSQPVLAQLTTAVDGGHAVSTNLLSLLITDDGQVRLGAVPVEALQAVR
ncbi:LolA family protein [Ruania albidiflava]|uniref:LolA family protein n=1 Tax=Ruania albidiflava TaxID=366586 RepID=UPI0003B5FDEF|nr:hypothetical protein [Ruania albidiflava]